MNIDAPKTMLEYCGWWIKWVLTWPVWSRIVCRRGHDFRGGAFCRQCDSDR